MNSPNCEQRKEDSHTTTTTITTTTTSPPTSTSTSSSSSSSSSSYTPPLLEVCVDNVISAECAAGNGAHRIELCSSLIEGGLTPSYGLIRSVRSAISSSPMKLMVLIRPRSGDFVYTPTELSTMRDDIDICRKLGVDGVVFGILTPNGEIHRQAMIELIQYSQPMEVTFHRAIDMTRDIEGSIKTLCELGIKRVLTSGGCGDAIKGQQIIQSLVSCYGNRITILAGGGLTSTNIPDFVRLTGVREVHASLRSQPKMGEMIFHKEGIYMGGEKVNNGLMVEYGYKYADGEQIRSVVFGHMK